MKKLVTVMLCLSLYLLVSGPAIANQSFGLAGTVVDKNTGRPISGVTIYFSDGSSPVLTDSAGRWSKTGLSGRIEVSADREGWFFSFQNAYTSSSQSVVIQGYTIEEFRKYTFENRIYTASGRITNKNGKGVAGVRILFDNDNPPVMTDVDGNWIKHGLRAEYQVTVGITPDGGPSWKFSPEAREISSSMSGLDFVGTSDEETQSISNETYVVSGRVTTQTGQGVPGVTISFSDGSAPAVTDDYGNWYKSGLKGTVTVTPSKTFWKFISPYMLIGSPTSMANFVGTLDTVIKVSLDTHLLVFDQEPIMKNGRILAPLRRIFEALGASVSYDPATQTITAVKENKTIRLKIGSVKAYINDSLNTLDQPPIVINGRTLVPLRFISEALGAKVYWASETNTAKLYSEERWTKNTKAEDLYIKGTHESFTATSLPFFNESLSIDPNFLTALYGRGFTYYSLGQYDKTIADMNKATALNGACDLEYRLRADAYQKIKQYDNAIKDYSKAIELGPPQAPYYYTRGWCYQQLNRLDEAKADFKKCLEIDPDYEYAKISLRNLGVDSY